MAEFLAGVVDRDFVRLFQEDDKGKKKHVATLAFGDRVEVGPKEGAWTIVRAPELFEGEGEWFVKGTFRCRAASATGVLRMSMVDVQQGDGLVFETPAGKTMLVDGGDNKLFARHLAERYRHRRSSAAKPVEIEAIVVTHGDADHFDGLNDIRRSETLSDQKARKRLFIHPKRVLHNGLVKRPSKRDGVELADEEQFGGSFVDVSGRTWATELVDDPRSVPSAERNEAFDAWAASIQHWSTRGNILVRRIHARTDPSEVFDFLEEEGIHVELLGPIQEEVDAGNGPIPALRFFAAPEPAPELHLEHGGPEPDTPSASHTINGHSIAMRLRYGNVRFMLTGDLNHASLDRLVEYVQGRPGLGTWSDVLEAEVVKAPHHGSHEFALAALAAMRPVVALVSSGDESAFKEYIHPRATLMAALGAVMRGPTGIVLCTELAAFFEHRQQAHRREALRAFFANHAQDSFTREELVALFRGEARGGADHPTFFEAFERTNFGIVHIRTDGERVLVFTHSARRGLNEAYRFRVTPTHAVTFEPIDTQ
jgi:beta-lactamase superfamily II metal-dependent hydrolase